MTSAQITCDRCRGRGIVDARPVYCGVPGGCYKCSCRGWVYADKFDEQFARDSGDFFGFSWEQNGVTVKYIARQHESDLLVDRGVKVTRITEDQARKFFNRYGHRTTV